MLRVFLPFMRFAPEGDGGGGAPGTEVAPAGSGSGTPGPDPKPVPASTGGVPTPPVDWRTGLPEDIRGEKVWETVKAGNPGEAFAAVAKRFVDAEKLIGRSVQLPQFAKDATPEQIARGKEQWLAQNLPKLQAAGLAPNSPPATADAYDLKAPALDGLPTINEQRLGIYRDGFHKLGVTQAQAQGLLELHAREVADGIRLMDQRNQEEIDKVEQRWGKDLFDRRWALANRALPRLANEVGMDPKAVADYLDTTRKGNDPILFQLLAAVGEAMDEDIAMDGESLGIMSPDNAQAKIDAIRQDPKHPWNQPSHPRYAEAQTEMMNLYKLAELARSKK